MADEPAVATPATSAVDPAGIARTATGEITTTPAEGSAASTTPTPAEGTTLLTEPAKTEPAKTEETKTETKAPKGAPEKYEDYRVPEGYEIAGELKTEIDGLFKGMGLSQENAQKLVDFYVTQTKDAFQAPFDAYKEMTDGWRKDAMDHPDLKGKLGPGQEVNVRIGKFLSGLPDQQLAADFRALMDLTGAGNHPAFIRVIDYAARMLGEGTHVAGNGPAPGGQSAPGSRPPSAAQAIFPNLPSSGR